jgi:hypothetical protein
MRSVIDTMFGIIKSDRKMRLLLVSLVVCAGLMVTLMVTLAKII